MWGWVTRCGILEGESVEITRDKICYTKLKIKHTVLVKEKRKVKSHYYVCNV